MRDSLSRLGLEASPDLVQLYGLCDGTDQPADATIGSLAVFPGFYWLTLEDAATIYRSLGADGQWKRAWFPIFANGGGDFYAVVADPGSAHFGEVVGFVLGEPDQIAEFRSVTTMLATIERSFSEGAFTVVEGFLEADYPRMLAIAEAEQPGFAEHVA